MPKPVAPRRTFTESHPLMLRSGVDFVTGAVTGRVFTENVRELPENIFYSDVVRGTEPKYLSARSTIWACSTRPAADSTMFDAV